MLFKDQLNRIVELSKLPRRIVSLVPSQTELLVYLGLEQYIVGVTKFCVHPNDIRKNKTIVGGTKTIRRHKILALQPDIILCNKEENSQAIINELIDIAPIHISDISSIENCYQLIEMYGQLFDVTTQAKLLILAIEKQRSNYKSKSYPKQKVGYFIWKNPWMVAASDTYISSMLEEAGFVNVFNDLKRYPEINLETAPLQDADILMLSSEPYPFKPKHIEVLKNRYPDKRIILVDGEMFSWHGSRLTLAFDYFETLRNSVINIK